MDFGVVGLDHHHHGLGISSSSSSSSAGFGPNTVISSSSCSDPETKQRILYGSGLSCNNNNNNNNNNNSDVIKQERSAGSGLEEYWRSSKVAKASGCGVVVVADDDDFSSACKGMMFQQRNSHNTLLRSNSNTASTTASTTTLSFLDNEQHYNQQSHQMLSFSTSSSSSPSAKSEAHDFATLPYFPSAYTGRNTASLSNTSNGSPMHGGVMMMRSGEGAGAGAGAGGGFTAAQWMELERQALIYKYITANVPIPPYLLLPIRKAFDSSPFPSAALIRSNPLGGWGAFHLGFSNNADPEPGRCRRTDGKKWRCSRDAVADQKYCERHMNRGRHRSRKPVEGQAGANNAAAAAAAAKPVALPGVAAAAATASNANNAHQQVQSFEINGAPNRMFMKDNNTAAPNGRLSLLSSKENSSLLFPRKQQQIAYDMSSSSSTRTSDLGLGGLVASDPQQGSLHQFIDDWPNKTRAMSTTAVASSWPDLGPQSDRTQLSISIPTTETNLSPLRLSREQCNDANNRQVGWIPISWGEASLGGPLGEALHQSNSTNAATNNNGGMMSDHCKSSSSTTSSSVLNLMPEGWDSSPPMGSSPTGVLQKTAFGSLSNSSAGSSPRAAAEGNRAHQHHHQEGIDLLGGSSAHLPAL